MDFERHRATKEMFHDPAKQTTKKTVFSPDVTTLGEKLKLRDPDNEVLICILHDNNGMLRAKSLY